MLVTVLYALRNNLILLKQIVETNMYNIFKSKN